jgi:hypothetical protein
VDDNQRWVRDHASATTSPGPYHSAVSSTVPHVYTSGLTSMVVITRATLAIGMVSAALLTYLVRLVLQWRRLSHVPGPLFASLSKGWMVKESLKGRQPTSFKEVNDKYGVYDPDPLSGPNLTTNAGSLARVGPNELITDDPEVLRKMMAARSEYTRGHCEAALSYHMKHLLKRHAGYNAMKFDPTRDNLFSMRDEVAHTKLRSKMAAGVSSHDLYLTKAITNQLSR